jgi:hypothetical protein
MSRALLFSFLLPLFALAQQPSELPPPGYNGGTDNPQNPTDAGAEGAQKGAFSLSNGALAAIIVVAVVVAIGGSMYPLHLLDLLTPTNRQQLAQQLSGGLRRSDNGTSDSLSAAHRAVLLAAQTQTTRAIAKTERPVSVLTRRLPGRVTSQDKIVMSRRVCPCRARTGRLQLRLRV